MSNPQNETPEVSAPQEAEETLDFTYQPKTLDELKTIALHILNGKIYSSMDIPGFPEDLEKYVRHLRCIFMVLALGGQEIWEQLAEQNIAFFYEYRSEAGPRMVNGLPQFMSMQVLNDTDFQKLREMILALEDAQKNILEKFTE